MKNVSKYLKELSKKNQIVGGFTQYDAQVNIASLIEKLFIDSPSINQFYTCNNFKCGQTMANMSLFPIDIGKLRKGIYTFLFFNNYPYKLFFFKKCF